MSNRKHITALILLCACPLPSHGQIGNASGSLSLNFLNGNTYDGSTPLVIEMWIGFDPQVIVAWGNYFGSIQSTDPTANWSDLQSAYTAAPGSSVGTVGNGSVWSIALAQLHFPPTSPGNTSNPIMIWSGEWSSGDLTPRVVDVTTITSNSLGYGGIHLYNLVFDDPTAQIQVIPAPPALAFLALASGLASRGRR